MFVLNVVLVSEKLDDNCEHLMPQSLKGRREQRKASGMVALSVIPAIWEAEIRRIEVRDQPRQIVRETPISKITRAK
jgi:hypothetical protein